MITQIFGKSDFQAASPWILQKFGTQRAGSFWNLLCTGKPYPPRHFQLQAIQFNRSIFITNIEILVASAYNFTISRRWQSDMWSIFITNIEILVASAYNFTISRRWQSDMWSIFITNIEILVASAYNFTISRRWQSDMWSISFNSATW